MGDFDKICTVSLHCLLSYPLLTVSRQPIKTQICNVCNSKHDVTVFRILKYYELYNMFKSIETMTSSTVQDVLHW